VQRRAERLEREKKAKKWAKKQRKMAAKAEKKRLKAKAAAERAEADAAFLRGEEMPPPSSEGGGVDENGSGVDGTGSLEGGSSTSVELSCEPLLPQTMLEMQANARNEVLEEAEASKAAAAAAAAEASSQKRGGSGAGGLFKASKASGFASVLPPFGKATAAGRPPAVAVIPAAYLSASAVQRQTRVEIEGPPEKTDEEKDGEEES